MGEMAPRCLAMCSGEGACRSRRGEEPSGAVSHTVTLVAIHAERSRGELNVPALGSRKRSGLEKQVWRLSN